MHYTHPLWRDLANHFCYSVQKQITISKCHCLWWLKRILFFSYIMKIFMWFYLNQIDFLNVTFYILRIMNRIYEIVLIVDIITLLYANLVVMYTDWLAHSTGCQLKLKHCSIFLQQEKNNAGVGFSTSISYEIIYLWQSLSFCARKGAINTE